MKTEAFVTDTGCCRRLQYLAPDADSRLAGWWCMVVVVVGGASERGGCLRCSGTGNRC